MTSRIDTLLDLHAQTKKEVLSTFEIDPSWHHFPLADERGRWWCTIADEIVSQYLDHEFSEDVVRRMHCKVLRIFVAGGPVIRVGETHTLVLIKHEFLNEFRIYDNAKQLDEEQTKLVLEHI